MWAYLPLSLHPPQAAYGKKKQVVRTLHWQVSLLQVDHLPCDNIFRGAAVSIIAIFTSFQRYDPLEAVAPLFVGAKASTLP